MDEACKFKVLVWFTLGLLWVGVVALILVAIFADAHVGLG